MYVYVTGFVVPKVLLFFVQERPEIRQRVRAVSRISPVFASPVWAVYGQMMATRRLASSRLSKRPKKEVRPHTHVYTSKYNQSLSPSPSPNQLNSAAETRSSTHTLAWSSGVLTTPTQSLHRRILLLTSQRWVDSRRCSASS